jgi:hypothetical protein
VPFLGKWHFEEGHASVDSGGFVGMREPVRQCINKYLRGLATKDERVLRAGPYIPGENTAVATPVAVPHSSNHAGCIAWINRSLPT